MSNGISKDFTKNFEKARETLFEKMQYYGFAEPIKAFPDYRVLDIVLNTIILEVLRLRKPLIKLLDEFDTEEFNSEAQNQACWDARQAIMFSEEKL